MSEEFKLAAKKGAAWLDQVYPEWTAAIDVEGLDLADSASCVLGQVGGDYAKVMGFLGARTDWAAEHGFDVPSNGPVLSEADWKELVQEYDELTEAWVEIIEERR